jgi:hypothetical protein
VAAAHSSISSAQEEECQWRFGSCGSACALSALSPECLLPQNATSVDFYYSSLAVILLSGQCLLQKKLGNLLCMFLIPTVKKSENKGVENHI